MLLTPGLHPLITTTVIEALAKRRLFTVLDFMTCCSKSLSSYTELSITDTLQIKAHLANKHSAVVRTGLEAYQHLIRNSAIISTGFPNLDETCLGGGLMTGNVYELCGCPASGKTLFCLTLVRNVVRDLEQHVYYLDSKRSFSAKKMLAMLAEEGYSNDQIAVSMSKILVKRLYTPYHLINALYEIKQQIVIHELKLRLIIVNSLPALFYGRESRERKAGLMSAFVNIMFLLAKEFHMVFVVTNLLTLRYEEESSTNDGAASLHFEEKISLGKNWQEVPNLRLKIIRQPDDVAQQQKYRICVMNRYENLLPMIKKKDLENNGGDLSCFINLK